ncbi:GAF domain-containing protein [Actinoplanes solisilvae]|uniref:GAF domain-containing protein n=1 Tax=Actinoplanes solisilvae TaxID=2486853 RepID=UPI0013E4090D|nr:GAF domain-containing protein [Actinoplanes solisilvae]
MNSRRTAAAWSPAEDQLDALRRVADLIARGAERETVLDAIVTETYRLFPVDFTAMLRYEADGVASIVAVHNGPAGLAIGERAPHIPEGLVLRVYRTGGPVRVESYEDLAGAEVARMHELGITAGAAAPILVEGELWGVLTAMTCSGPVIADLEHHLAEFAEIAAAAVAGAQARDDRRGLADEQAALRRVAALAARGADPDDVFEALAVEAVTLLPGHSGIVARFDRPGAATVLADRQDHVADGWSTDPVVHELAVVVRRTGRAARIDDYQTLPGPADPTRSRTATAGAAVPLHIDDAVWGMLAVVSFDKPLPPDTERRLSPFAEIAAVATSGARARAGLLRLVDEQAALRRVAELVTRRTGEQELFDAVTTEAATLIGDVATTLVRSTGEGTLTVVATHHGSAPVGSTIDVPGDDQGAVEEMLRTWQAARPDDGAASSTGVPVMVDDRMWGMLVVATADRLPADTEQRLQQFAGLVASALANSRATARIQHLARQQAALREVAELAARGAPTDQVLEAVAVQASFLAGVDFTTVLRYEPDGSTEIMALSGAPAGVVVGMRAPGTGDGAVQRVWRTRRSARVDDLAGVAGRWPRVAFSSGFSASAAVPIHIHGGLWGALVAVGSRPLSAAVEDDLASFAHLTGTAISSAQARHDLRALAEEQAALRRVAELVARGTALEEVFEAVAVETSRLLGGRHIALRRYDRDGSATTVATHGVETTRRAGTELAVTISVEGRGWGELRTWAAEPSPPGGQERLRQFAELAAAAIANAENKTQLTASRARVVATADETRRRLQRDVHDGAQQRLVHTILALRLARDAAARGDTVTDEIDEALHHAERANAELRDLVHGILPAALTRGGLSSGLESLISDINIPVELRLTGPRLPKQLEITVYFIVAEALTNVVKHARATHADVSVEAEDAGLSIEVRDDGIGGADPLRGSGLTGLSDRVQAAEGTLTLSSPEGGGTTVRVRLPVP